MSDGSVDLGWMRLLVEIARRGSLSAAAEGLGLTQPAVSYQMRLLEQRLGVPLLTRLHRGVRLTEEGRRLLVIAERTVQEVDALQRDIRHARRRPVIRLATDYAFSSLWLIPRMPGFRRQYPEIDLQIVAAQRLTQNWREQADLAVAFGARADVGEEAVLLMPERVVPVCAPALRDRLERSDLADLGRDAPRIHLEAEAGSPWLDWRSYAATAGLPAGSEQPTGDLRFNTYAMVVQAALGGQGIALGWLGIVDQLLEAGLLVVSGEAVDVPDRGYWLLGTAGDRAAAQLGSWLQDEATVITTASEHVAAER
ncbi:LysR family transcriptional regulator [Rhizobium sp. Root274]|uniref:choline sulfate utilization transcriptional regulator n=1 Tax=unclassified Rhizobium TaxID=2613769 RepID=UPI0007159E2B|nr:MULTISPECIES: LysR substrate-binding domain-containing protein [unclassified Rhizobium]KQW30996.1 LysR family transcriptional regulator [Rhizobium sp. Root1240]KRD32543.1 LysR family transcriptional regulator [Rhizobium sp. Root274]